MTPLRALRKTAFVLAVAFACAVVVCLLPENRYQRWQLLDGTIHANARWIFERIRFDPTPIDVVLLGPSRMGQGISAPRLGEALRARGLPGEVVNFSLPEEGRNTNWVVAEELFARKRPKLVVLGVIEKPYRYGHAAFKYVADPGAIADPGYLGDLNYLSDLVYLPFRSLRLFAAELAPGGLGLAKTFDPAQYRGSSVDTTGSVVLPDGRIKDGEDAAPEAELMRGVRKLQRGTHPPILPERLADLEFGDERSYTRRIAELAEAHGAKVAFLFIPYYTGPGELSGVLERKLYEQYGPVWNAGWLSPHAEWFADYGHLTRAGAGVLTDWLAGPVASALKSSEASR